MLVEGELKRALLKVSERAKNERIISEKNYRLVSRGISRKINKHVLCTLILKY